MSQEGGLPDVAIPSRHGRINVVWSAVDFAVVPVAMLLATPIFIHTLGIEEFGVLVLVSSFVGFSAVFNFGFGDTALKFVSHHVNLNAKERAAEIARTIGLLSLVSGLTVGGLFALCTPLMVKLFGLSGLSYAAPTLHITALIMTLRMLESVYISMLRGCYRYDLSGAMTVITKLTNIGFQVVLAIMGYDLPALLLVTVATTILSVIALFILGSIQIGRLVPAFSRSAFLETREFSFWSWLQGISGFVYVNTDRLMVSALLGPAALGVYGVCLQLAQNIHYGLAAVAHSLFPKISMLNAERLRKAEESEKSLRLLYLMVGRSLTVMAVLGGVTMAVFSYQILEIWVGANIAQQGDIILALLSVSFSWFAANSIITYYTLNGLGLVRQQANVSVVGSGIMVLSSVICISLFGLLGAAAARLPDALFRMCVRMYIGKRVIGGISIWSAFDFVRITVVAFSVGVPVKMLLISRRGGDRLSADPMALGVIFVSGAIGFLLIYRIERWLGLRRVAQADLEEMRYVD